LQCLKDIGKDEAKVSQCEIDDWYLKKLENGEDLDLLRLSSTGKPEHYVPPSETRFASSLWSDLRPNGSQQLRQIFQAIIFENPKSVDLVKRLICFSGTSKKDIVLDSFAGSGTTAQARNLTKRWSIRRGISSAKAKIMKFSYSMSRILKPSKAWR